MILHLITAMKASGSNRPRLAYADVQAWRVAAAARRVE
jgi:hypothetical protein